MLVFKRIIAGISLIVLLFGIVILAAMMALGGGFILNGITHLGWMSATVIFLGTTGVCAFIVGLIVINDHLGKMAWVSQEDDDLEWDEEELEEEDLDEMETEFAPQRPAAGRNHPCPCGSGKKYKRCCLKQGKSQNMGLHDIPF